MKGEFRPSGPFYCSAALRNKKSLNDRNSNIMNYDFNNVDKFLREGGKPEDVMNAFADVVNNSLATMRTENKLATIADKIAEAWNDYVDEYFTSHKLPTGYTVADWYIDGKDVSNLIEKLISVVPTIEKWFDTLNAGAKQLKTTTNNTKDVVADFFTKFGI